MEKTGFKLQKKRRWGQSGRKGNVLAHLIYMNIMAAATIVLKKKILEGSNKKREIMKET
jgi:hypothetical protein